MQVSKKAIARSGRSVLAASDQLDDGSPITLRVELDPECGGALFDFTGTSPQVSSLTSFIYFLRMGDWENICVIVSSPLNLDIKTSYDYFLFF